MIHLYPANKMENLLALLDKIHQVSPLPVFAKEVIIVQNAGMQHWLNMSLAQSRKISLGNEFLLPAQFLWQLMRSLASAEKVPDQSPYSREALCWRIYQELACDEVVANDIYHQVTHYWNQSENSNEQALKRYQLSCQLADLYEQYLIFRPEWIDAWYQGRAIDNLDSNTEQLSAWQSDLWLRLTESAPYNPLELMQSAIDNIADNLHLLPQRISFFGINAMAPMWLAFINAISEHTQVHFFHLNPCFNYWGDIKTHKQALQHMTEWTSGYEDISHAVGNPLLANLGQQGREFLALLQEYSTIDIDVYQSFLSQEEHQQSADSVLALIQEDILNLTDGCQQTQHLVDDSIVITSAHSALREVQGLHDWLLNQFNQNPDLTPKDVLVMCPQVEEYAPYVQAVFANGWQDLSGDIPPLPCSISDRVSKDSNPLVIGFTEILSLPDSRFCVSQIISWLRIPAVQHKFGFTNEDIQICSQWLNDACIHWGLNQSHKQQILNSQTISGQFTWQFGFTKLLQGFAYSDQESLYQDNVLLPNVEGNDALILGNLMLFIEQLQSYATTLSQAKTASHWHEFLSELLNDFFEISDESGFIAINNAIDALVEYCQHAEFNELISLNIIKEFLNTHFSQPDAGRQFMVGQVTFCSMLPMRSIPFKVIAVLGLNDGEFPRQRQPLGFDLIALQPSQSGDRSRRGDDKYLFLEAIISARHALYLSYQGRNIKKNSIKEPSVVLKELMNYLALAYDWHFDFTGNNDELTAEQENKIRQLPMQAFSLRNFTGTFPSFDANWLTLGKRLLKQSAKPHKKVYLPLFPIEETALKVSLSELVNFYAHPAKYFAKRQLNLYLDKEQIELNDVEPFSFNRLESYLFNQALLSLHLNEPQEQLATSLTKLSEYAKASGKFPDLPTMDIEYQNWQSHSEMLASAIKDENNINNDSFESISGEITLPILMPEQGKLSVTIQYHLPVNDKYCLFYRSTTAKIKDKLSLYLSQLLVQVINSSDSGENQPDLSSVVASKGYYFNTKTQQVNKLIYQDLDNPYDHLITLIQGYVTGLQQPVLLNGELAEKVAKSKNFDQQLLTLFWDDPNNAYCLGNDPYMRYFWPECPELSGFSDSLMAIYQPMFSQLKQVKG
ncbi:exodeoxyribonuclease V subunit gamma [Thalassotalea piscium]